MVADSGRCEAAWTIAMDACARAGATVAQRRTRASAASAGAPRLAPTGGAAGRACRRAPLRSAQDGAAACAAVGSGAVVERWRATSPFVRAWLPLAVFSAAAVVFTYPLAWRLGEGLAGDGADANLFVWNHWWLAQALERGVNPYVTDMIFWPVGTSLVLHTFSPYHGVLALLLTPWTGDVAAYNLLVILSFALCGWAGYLLARDVSGSEAAAYIGGFAFGFTSYHYAHALGHLNLLAYHWLPLLLLFFMRYARTGRRRDALFAGLMLVGAGLTDLSLLISGAFLTGVFSLAWHGWRDLRAHLRVLAVGGVAALLFSPWLVMIFRQYARSPELVAYGAEAARYSLDLFSFFVPTPLSTLYADVGRVLPRDGTATEATLFVGYLVLALAAYGLWRRPWRETRPWAVTAAVFGLLSLGPSLQVLGHATGIPLPYTVLGWLPIFSSLRTPARFGLLVVLCVSILATMGAADILARARRVWRPARGAAVALICLVVIAEMAVLPYPLTPLRYSSLYEDAKALGTEAIVDLPLHQPGYAGQLGRVNYMAAQTRHEMPMVNGYNARQTYSDVQTLHAHQVLALIGRLELGDAPPEQRDVFPDQDARAVAGELLARRGMTTLLLHRNEPPTAAEAREIELLRTLEGVRLVKEAPDGALYQAVRSEDPPPVILDLGAGWHAMEMLGGHPIRWSVGRSEVIVYASRAMEAELSLDVMPFVRARTLVIELNGAALHEQDAPAGWSGVRLHVTLAEGENVLALRSLEPAQTAREVGLGWDTRQVSLGFRNLRVEPVSS